MTNEKLKLNIELKELDESVKGPIHIERKGDNLIDLVLQYPIEFTGNNKVKGKIDFGLRIRINNTYSNEENKNQWYL